jgi:ABC-type amino acid transport substrate-binding protein
MRLSRRANIGYAAVGTVFALLLGPVAAASQTAETSASTPSRLVVGVFDAPPFSEPLSDGGRAGPNVEWAGPSIRLFSATATRLSIPIEFRSGTETEILAALERGEIDACASPLVPTTARLGSVRFTHAFASLGIGAATVERSGLVAEASAIVSSVLAPTQYRMFATIAFFVLLAAFLVWIAERRRNPHFGGKRHAGFGSSLWWSVVTLSTVGYGDKVPATVAGRLVAAGWMLLSLVLTTILTATIVSAITVGSLSMQPISRPADLTGIRVVAVRGSISAEWLAEKGIAFRATDTPEDAALALVRGEARAMVAPRAELAALERDHPSIVIAPVVLTDEFASFAFRRSIDQAFFDRFDHALVEVRAMLEPNAGLVPVETLAPPTKR